MADRCRRPAGVSWAASLLVPSLVADVNITIDAIVDNKCDEKFHQPREVDRLRRSRGQDRKGSGRGGEPGDRPGGAKPGQCGDSPGVVGGRPRAGTASRRAGTLREPERDPQLRQGGPGGPRRRGPGGTGAPKRRPRTGRLRRGG